ncbi:alpha/beta hydrolase [Microbacterium lacus]|uniref:alpha/beta fold hydrolase n=1 Tax=Microbacterium lacus TaxID=415217 RepID=UPI00384CA979
MPPLVLLAGMNCTADLWADCGLESVIAPTLDLPSIDAQVERLLDELPDRFVLAGLSLGAIVAMSLAVRAPERVSALCVMSTNAKGPTPAQHSAWAAWIARLDAGESPRALQEEIVAMLLSPAAQLRDDVVERTLAMGDDTPPETLRAQLLLQSTRTDLRSALESIDVPTLVVSADADALCPPSFHTEIAEAVPRARMVTLEGGHLLPLERGEAVGALLRGWLAQSG